MDSKIGKGNHIKLKHSEGNVKIPLRKKNNTTHIAKLNNGDIEDLCDENLTTLKKIHAILLNCSNLSKNQKLEFCESERYFMKLYLNKLKEKKSYL